MKEAAAIYWTEYERGWGTRPDGTSLHVSVEDAQAYIASYWAEQPQETPDEYSRPGDPFPVLVTEEMFVNVVPGKIFWLDGRRHIDFKKALV